MYVDFPGGTTYPDGYVAPCNVIKEIPGWAQVRLSVESEPGLTWAQWVRKSQLLTDSEAEAL